MPSKKKELARFTAEIMDSAVKTIGGIRFSEAAVLGAYAQIIANGCTIEELDQAGRKKKGVRLDESWNGHAMAKSTGATLEGTVLKVQFSVPDTRYGKILMATADTAGGFGMIRFLPVGQATPDADGNVDVFKLSYVTFTVNLKPERK